VKKLILWVIALVSLPVGTLLGQDITGTWQGTLQFGAGLRTVIKVSKADDGGLKAVMFSIDQGGQSIPAGAVTLQSSVFKMSIPGIGGAYEGKLSADGASMAGTFTQGDKPMPLNLKRVTADEAWPIPEPPARPKPMAADANPVFEVATIKPSKPDTPGKGIRVIGRQFSTLNTSLSDLMVFTYGIHARQIAGGPAWLESDRYDLQPSPTARGSRTTSNGRSCCGSCWPTASISPSIARIKSSPPTPS
jgi:hypothetical protein